MDGKRGRADVLHADMLACGCVACEWMRCVWMDALRVDENKYKEKEEKKDLLQVECERVDVLACGRELDADGCEEKEKEKKRNTYWMQILDADSSGCKWWNTRISGGAVDDSACVSLYLEIFVRVRAATHY